MRYIEQKKEKKPLLFKLSDFIPERGLKNYKKRNPPEFEKYPLGFLRNIKELHYEEIKTHKNILEAYNFTIGLIAEGAIYYTIIKPITDFLVENIFK